MRKIILVLSVILLASIYNIVEANSVVDKKTQKVVEGKTLILNGYGMRYATIFKVKVYKAGLYLQKMEKNPSNIIKSDSPKLLELRFLRDVGKEKIQNGWVEGFENNKVKKSSFKKEIDLLLAGMREIKENDLMSFTFLKDRVDVKINGEKTAEIKSALFPSKLILLWLGNPPNDELKNGLLGLKE